MQRHHEHKYHQQAVDSTYVWPYKQDRAADGLYTVDLSVWNDQRTAQAFGTAQFEIGSGLVLGCGEGAHSLGSPAAGGSGWTGRS